MRAHDICLECGGPEEEHHHFQPYVSPDGCVCDPRDWGNPYDIPAVCAAFVPMSDKEPDLCRNCQHETHCHRVSP